VSVGTIVGSTMTVGDGVGVDVGVGPATVVGFAAALPPAPAAGAVGV
jgi:hypothetical protein